MYSGKITKLSRYNHKQTRIFCLTFHFIYIFNGKKINRRHKVTNLVAIIMSKKTSEFVLHFPAAKDLRVSGLKMEDRTEIINLIQNFFSGKEPNRTLQRFVVPEESLKEYSQDNSKYGFINLPDEKFRDRANEFVGKDDEEKSMKPS